MGYGQRSFYTGALDAEEARRFELSKPPAKDNPDRLKLVQVRVVKAFMHDGRRANVGDLIKVPAYQANGLVLQKRAELV